jgi:translocation and assembly module TamA
MAGASAQQAPEINITGGDEVLVANIRTHLRIGRETCDTPLARLERLRTQVTGNVQRAAEALGYYRLTATAAFSRQEDCWRLLISVTPGDRILVNEVSIHLPEDPEISAVFNEVLAESPNLAGAPLHHGEYEAIKNALSATAVENGFFSARFERSEIRVDLATYSADIDIAFEPGSRYRFGVIRVQPVPGFADAFINSMVLLETGQPYSSAALLEQRVQLDETQYFSQISITPQLSSANNQSVPVLIELIPRLRHAWSTGIGFTTDTGPRVRAAYENRYINTRGHRLDSDAAVSSVRSRINLGYGIPLDDPLTTSLNFATGYITENTDTYDSDRYQFETAYRHESASGWLETWAINHLRDDYVINQQEDSSMLTMLGYSLARTVTDNIINPSRGWRLFGEIRGATDAVISDTSFVQLYTSGKGIISLGPGRFITRFEAGTTWIDDTEELPVSIRYFAGGDQSIRGYQYQSLGPLNADGEVIGGKHLFAGSVEYDFPVKNNWRAALFYDGGNAFSSQKFDWKQSVGIGVRWLSPIGPIRADLAHALNDEGGFRLHITMGPDL